MTHSVFANDIPLLRFGANFAMVQRLEFDWADLPKVGHVPHAFIWPVVAASMIWSSRLCFGRYIEWGQMMNTQLLQQASVLEIDEQIKLVEAIWDGIVSRGLAPSLTEAQVIELDRRMIRYLANPDDVVPWSDVKAAAIAKIRQ